MRNGVIGEEERERPRKPPIQAKTVLWAPTCRPLLLGKLPLGCTGFVALEEQEAGRV